MVDNIRILPGVAAPTEPNLENALTTLDFLRTEIEAGRVVAVNIVTLSPKDDTSCYLINVGRKNAVQLLGAASVFEFWLHRRSLED